MKKILFAVLAVTFIAASCSKESKLNRRLDGTWNVLTFGGVALPTGATMTLAFDKDKKGKGTYTMTQTMPPSPAMTDAGTYDLNKDEIMYLLSSTAGSTQDTMNVTSYSKTEMTLTGNGAVPTVITLKKQ